MELTWLFVILAEKLVLFIQGKIQFYYNRGF